MPKSEATVKTIQGYGKAGPNRVTDVADPTIAVFRPEKPNGTSVIVAPGGGYMFLSWVHEGTQVCEWLNSLGVTAVLLKYRTPTRDREGNVRWRRCKTPSERARAGATSRGRLGTRSQTRRAAWILSRRENLAGHVAWDRGARGYPQNPDLDDPRGPDFVIFIYGGGFLDTADKSKFREGFSVPSDAPPAFFLVAHDDKSNPIEAAMLYLAYKKQNLSAELHICPQGWTRLWHAKGWQSHRRLARRCGEWMKSLDLLGAK